MISINDTKIIIILYYKYLYRQKSNENNLSIGSFQVTNKEDSENDKKDQNIRINYNVKYV